MKKTFFLIILLISCLSSLYAQKNDYKIAFFVDGKEWDLTQKLSLKEKPKLDIRVVASNDAKNRKDMYAIDEIAFGPIYDTVGFAADGLIRAKNKDASLGIRVTTPFDLKAGDTVQYRVHQVFIRKENGSWTPIENSSVVLSIVFSE